ncbi:dihydropteroate synthase [Paenibacillus sp. GCM10023248]|uniref:dihydropteroate synthase n=1 Tax=Bacillales TaxID=1385 RepID=UPI002379C8FC|nr:MULTISPECIES: dihydropteroate synthase [Bacillales]MDD9272067.1 dihydropteroate synthase [Paenibacillus sp. MAHUQ-63]MDR6885178.1 dihydropteroate synthase [Bacillus sp. 3255]
MNVLSCRGHELPIGDRTIIMGILNITPDSFSDGGSYVKLEDAVRRARQMVEDGADIIDIGGESTRPGAAEVTEDEELRRVIPVIEAIRREIDVPLSVDTYKAEVAKQALAAGAHIINDVWGGQADPRMAEVAAAYDCPFIITHNRKDTNYVDFFADVQNDLLQYVKQAREAGVREERIILDPGIGFAKSYEQNLQLLNRLRPIVELGYPVLLGTSRKSVIGMTLNLPPAERLEGSLSTIVLGIAQGCGIVRVHDVQATKRAAVMTDAIIRA